jgi:cyclic pyranopterin phosphate synthase
MEFDAHHRPLRALRVSVTDRCNLRCQYCMPEAEYVWLPRESLLHFEEIQQLVRIFAGLGVDKLRLTGGEPLLRRDLPKLVRLLAEVSGIRDFALTTNGVLLADQAEALSSAGLHRITVSLDTLDPGRFTELTRMACHARILEGIATASRVFGSLKLDMVVMRGINDGEMVPMLEFARGVGAEVRFIEYMDVAGATKWSMDRVLPRSEILQAMERRYGPITPVVENTAAPADRFTLPDGTVFGIVASTTTPFCSTCDRSRLTADGLWYLCLYASHGTDLRTPLRRGDPEDEIRALIEGAWHLRQDRGAEERLASGSRAAFVPASTLRKDPHLEMHTRGG